MKFLYILFVFGILLGTACHVRLLSRSSADSVSALKSVGGTGILTHINNDTLNPKEIRYIVKNGYNIIESLPAGYRRDGTVDYTTYVQDAINSHKLIVFPGFPIMINDNGLSIPSNRSIVFLDGSIVLLKPSARKGYHILLIHNSSNVKLYSPVIVGDRRSHLGDAGEWGMGIGILSSTNIYIYNPKISFCWGDGIYIAKKGVNNARNIVIEDAHCDRNRRNGISIISVDGLKLIRPRISNSDGTRPMAGIDIEPNTVEDNINDISIVNPITINNRIGISMFFNRSFTSKPKKVIIRVVGHHDYESEIGTSIITQGKKESVISNELPLSGSITIESSSWENSGITPVAIHSLKEHQLNVSISRSSILKDDKKFSVSKIKKIIQENTRSVNHVSIRE